MKIKTVLFDLDGVLIDSLDAMYKVHNIVAKKMGYPPVEKKKLLALTGMEWGEMIKAAHPDITVDIEKFKKLSREVGKVESEKIKFIGNPIETLKKLKRMNYKLAIVSGSHRDYAKSQLKRLNFDMSLLDLMVNSEDTKKHKPYPDPILFALKKLKVNPNETLYVGDNILDFEAAKSANVHFIGALSGVSAQEDFSSNGVIYTIDNIDNLLNYLNGYEFIYDRQTVSVFLKHKDKILLLRRSGRVTLYQDKWAVIHGRINTGENPEERARKEIEEEVGIKNVKLLKKGKPVVLIDKELGIKWNIYPFLFETNSDKVKINWEHSDFNWVKPEEIKQYNTISGFYEIYKTVS